MSSFPTLTRAFFERADELTPVHIIGTALLGLGVNGNFLRAATATTLTISPSYSGPAYTFAGPPDPAVSPVQLGFEKGDLIQLIAVAGTPANAGFLFSISDPSTLAVIGPALTVDSVDYHFRVWKQRTGVWTDYGRQVLAYLMAWKTLGTTDAAFTEMRLRWAAFGKGQQNESRFVIAMQDPLTIATTPSPGQYAKALEDTQTKFPNVTKLAQGVRLDPSELSHAGQDPTLVSEFGLSMDARPEISGSVASINRSAGLTLVTGLEGKMLPIYAGMIMTVVNGDNSGDYRINTVLDDSSVYIARTTPTGLDSGSPNIQWTVGNLLNDSGIPLVAYMNHEGIVKTSSFSFELGWELRV